VTPSAFGAKKTTAPTLASASSLLPPRKRCLLLAHSVVCSVCCLLCLLSASAAVCSHSKFCVLRTKSVVRFSTFANPQEDLALMWIAWVKLRMTRYVGVRELFCTALCSTLRNFCRRARLLLAMVSLLLDGCGIEGRSTYYWWP
jgi:hypothetical protein